MRWCVAIRALKTTTQLALPALSISVSAIWGTFTLVSWVAWIRSEKHKAEEEQEVRWWIIAGERPSAATACANDIRWVRNDKQECARGNAVQVGLGSAAFHRRTLSHPYFNSPSVFPRAVFPQIGKTSAKEILYLVLSANSPFLL